MVVAWYWYSWWYGYPLVAKDDNLDFYHHAHRFSPWRRSRCWLMWWMQEVSEVDGDYQGQRKVDLWLIFLSWFSACASLRLWMMAWSVFSPLDSRPVLWYSLFHLLLCFVRSNREIEGRIRLFFYAKRFSHNFIEVSWLSQRAILNRSVTSHRFNILWHTPSVLLCYYFTSFFILH